MSATFYHDLEQWQQLAEQYCIQGNYIQAASLYEQAIEAEPEVKLHYWHLGLMLLLQEQEQEAHTTWLLGMVEGEPEQIDEWTVELVKVLDREAQRREEQEEFSQAWLIRQHIRELQPTNINNLLYLIQRSIQLEKFTGDDLADWGAMNLLKAEPPANLHPELLLQTLESVLEAAPLHPASLELVEASLAYVEQPLHLLQVLLPAATECAYSQGRPGVAASLAELYLRVEPENTEFLRHLAAFYQNAGQYQKGIETAQLCYSLLTELADRVFANNLILRGLLSAGAAWKEAYSIFQRHQKLMADLVKEQPTTLRQIEILRLFTTCFYAPYLQDDLKANKQLQTSMMRLCQANIEVYARERIERYQKGHLKRRLEPSGKPLKIGYLSACFKEHSVGWLARGVFEHHNREEVKIYAYFVNYKRRYKPLEEWYISKTSQAFYSVNSWEIADKIFEDEIDILIELDSITLDMSCEVMALKPAPVQVTWLGWDASEIPTIDYFIADPYVLPTSAQEYYTEKIWRLPQTYIAVDGFEIGVPTVRREDFEIPQDAIVYFSGQTGYKRHTETARLQMRIIKEVPNSYLLIKGIADREAIEKLFIQLAKEEGVDRDQLRFLPLVGSELLHRANLGIADVVLDTYPYNGATTTMETLWMGIPMVTRVGEQFASRNSYTMMMNAGITEGIAWTDEEYVQWGIRLGKEPALRQQIAWKLWQSRKTSPLWNAKQFTREMEKAYEQMWENYLQGY
ncbi:O-linked N-acetylglucosamine transferase, SPINDLY family protein [Microcoleus sp. FACHB-68]|uniref:O-linked N-acetylglucosamine transferase, SPINDLY family protein n=1 Tax=Microcoleus sp. FACHB-68 TaxID=2692826 RepID=UPI001684282C|nr:O-linked N-acetylglucosamine transferase, SPINDLY family protein [Microcoleus sp. FACHB-68]MBD1937495.1 O-linked N-acetylglucosamine transferase, SPINDLY family protein [Microcoleus sp. FACHB-68]